MLKNNRTQSTRRKKSIRKIAPVRRKRPSDAGRGLYLRFENAGSKEKVRKAAKAAGVSLNRYITAASIAWAKAAKRLDPIAITDNASLAS